MPACTHPLSNPCQDCPIRRQACLCTSFLQGRWHPPSCKAVGWDSAEVWGKMSVVLWAQRLVLGLASEPDRMSIGTSSHTASSAGIWSPSALCTQAGACQWLQCNLRHMERELVEVAVAVKRRIQVAQQKRFERRPIHLDSSVSHMWVCFQHLLGNLLAGRLEHSLACPRGKPSPARAC